MFYCYNTNLKYNSKIYLCKQLEIISKKEYKLLFGNAQYIIIDEDIIKKIRRKLLWKRKKK